MNILELIKNKDQHAVIGAMIEGQSYFGKYSRTEHICDFKKDAIYYNGYSVLIRVEKFLDTLLDIDDDFAQFVNEVIYNEGEEIEDSNIIIEALKDMDYDIDERYSLSDYTYNNVDSCNLDRDIVYHTFKYDGDYYAFIQVHHGADARWGFGHMVCFRVKDIDYFMLGMQITAYDTVSDEDVEMWKLIDIAEYNENTDMWTHKETGHEIALHTSANGF